MTAYDIERCKETWFPYKITEYGLRYHPDGTPYIFYGTKAIRMTADRVALLAIDPQGQWHFTGVYLPVKGTAYVGYNIVPGPGWCFAINAEISTWAVTWQRWRKDVIVGCIP